MRAWSHQQLEVDWDVSKTRVMNSMFCSDRVRPRMELFCSDRVRPRMELERRRQDKEGGRSVCGKIVLIPMEVTATQIIFP
jgi:predicted nucleic acid-binding Zn ribbon protein